jgi:hypothetical protein
LNLGVLPEALIRLGRLLRISKRQPKPEAKGSSIKSPGKSAAAE